MVFIQKKKSLISKDCINYHDYPKNIQPNTQAQGMSSGDGGGAGAFAEAVAAGGAAEFVCAAYVVCVEH